MSKEARAFTGDSYAMFYDSMLPAARTGSAFPWQLGNYQQARWNRSDIASDPC